MLSDVILRPVSEINGQKKEQKILTENLLINPVLNQTVVSISVVTEEKYPIQEQTEGYGGTTSKETLVVDAKVQVRFQGLLTVSLI